MATTSFSYHLRELHITRPEWNRSVSRTRKRLVACAAASSMRYNKLGDSDLIISEATLGTMTWGVQNTEEDAHEQLSYAFDNGVNMLDTAEMYPVPPSKDTQGRTDRYISSWLKSQQRDKVLIATKVAGYSERSSYLRESGKTIRVDAENIKESVEKSLQRLGTDYIDLLQIHWPDRYVPLFGELFYDVTKWRESVPFEEQLEALQSVIQEGKVRFVGVSNESSFGVMKFTEAAKTHGLPKIISIQNSYSLLVRCRFEVDLAEVCSEQNCNVGLLAYSPLAGGALTGKYAKPVSMLAKKGRFNLFPGYMGRYNSSLAQEAVNKYVSLGEQHGLTPVQLSLGYIRDRPFVASTIIGATTMEQLKENIDAFQVTRPLPDDVIAGVEEIFKYYKDITI